MKKNIVLLDVDDYNNLRDFKKEITDGNTCYVYGCHGSETFISKEETVRIIANQNDRLKGEVKSLKKDKGRQRMIDEIKSMNWWQFRRWKQRRE